MESYLAPAYPFLFTILQLVFEAFLLFALWYLSNRFWLCLLYQVLREDIAGPRKSLEDIQRRFLYPMRELVQDSHFVDDRLALVSGDWSGR